MTRKKALHTQETCLITGTGRSKGKIKVALVFPNTYFVGMSNLGFQVIYGLLNRQSGITCERFFIPDDPAGAQRIKSGRRSGSIETGEPLEAFHVVAFSLSFENDYLNVPALLSNAGIPLLQKKRPPSSPLVIAGGIAASLNPEPLADIFDLFIIGEAEEVLAEFFDALLQHQHARGWKKPPLETFARIRGIYVPSGYDVTYSDNGLIREFSPHGPFPERVCYRHTHNLDDFPSVSCLLTPDTEFSGTGLVEVSRGCPRQCRFCAVRGIYSPYRYRRKATVLQSIASLSEKTSKIGILGAAVSDYPGLPDLLRDVIAKKIRISTSSLRADTLSDEIVGLLTQCRQKTFTIAPEAGSSRMRDVIAKNLTSDDIFRAVRILSSFKVPAIRLYFLIGLPTEKEEDIRAIVQLAKEIKHVYISEAKGDKWLNRITLSVSPFVPKPCTPFQWHPFEQVSTLKQKLKIITGALRKETKITVNHDLPKWGYIQTLLSRGDRRVTRLLLKACALGGDWSRAFRESDLNPDFYVYRMRDPSELLPWHFIDHGLNTQRLWDEYLKALDEG